VTSWAVVVPRHLSTATTEFVSALRKTAYNMGFLLPNPEYREIAEDRITTYIEGIESAVRCYNPKLIFVVLPNNRLDRYRYVQKAD
jgi:hypothetical protein